MYTPPPPPPSIFLSPLPLPQLSPHSAPFQHNCVLHHTQCTHALAVNGGKHKLTYLYLKPPFQKNCDNNGDVNGLIWKPWEHNSFHTSTPLFNYAVLMCLWTVTCQSLLQKWSLGCLGCCGCHIERSYTHWKLVRAHTLSCSVSPGVYVSVERDLGAVICLKGSAALLYDAPSDVASSALHLILTAAHFEPHADHIPFPHATSKRANKHGRKMCLKHQGGFIYLFRFSTFSLQEIEPES